MDDVGVGLFGGTFDPIHCGHLIAARSIREQLGLDRIIVIPAGQSPHKTHAPITEAHHRLNMIRLAVEGEEGFAWDDCELHRSGLSYTYDTVMDSQTRLGPAAQLHWIIGEDSLTELASWYRIGDLVRACRIVTVSRPGCNVLDLAPLQLVLHPAQLTKLRKGIIRTPGIDISATDIRRRVAAGRSIRFLVPEPVRHYIEQHGLYR